MTPNKTHEANARMDEARTPFHLSDDVWLYEEPRGILVVIDVKDNAGTHLRTEQHHIPWAKVKAAVQRREYALAKRRARS
jgi:desulfoferrodoxin (superoxide reductase-like protein)